MVFDDDTQQGVATVYKEYLADRYQNDLREQRHRSVSFDTGHPAQSDMAAIKAAREVYTQTAANGGTDRQATDAARDALYGEFDREQIMEKEVNRHLYYNNSAYYDRMNAMMDEKVEEKRLERQQSKQPAETQEHQASREAESHLPEAQQNSQQQDQIDWQRYTQDREYRLEVVEQEKNLDQRQEWQVAAQNLTQHQKR